MVFELWCGVAKSARADTNAQRLTPFMAGLIEVLDFGVEDDARPGTFELRWSLSGGRLAPTTC